MTGLASDRIVGERRTAASAVEVPIADGAPARRIHLFNIGDNPARDGRTNYRVDDLAHAERIIAASNAYHRSTEPMVDYDHQSVYGAKDGVGGRAEASGWMKGFSADAGGIWAEVEWTQAAAAALVDKRYRYISPYFGHAADGRVTRIFNAALTNRPELELRAAASQSDDPLNLEIRMSAITGALGLADDADENAIVSAINTLKGDRTAVCSALGLAASATGEEMRVAASAGAADATRFVPRAEFDTVRGQLDQITEARITASVDDAIQAGKVTPASRDWALGYAKKDPAGFATFVGGAPAIVSETAEQRRAAAAAADTLTEEEKATCSQMGISPEDYLKSRKEFTL